MTDQDLEQLGWRRRELPGFIGLVGPLWTRREGDAWAYGILVTEQHLNPAGIVHGGLAATLADHALSAIAWEHAGRRPCVTVQLETRFVAAARAHRFLAARGSVLRAAGSLLFMRGQVLCEDELILDASAIHKVVAAHAG